MEDSGSRGNKSIISVRHMTRRGDGHSHPPDRLAQERQEKPGRDLQARLPPGPWRPSSRGPSSTFCAGTWRRLDVTDTWKIQTVTLSLVRHGAHMRARCVSSRAAHPPLTSCDSGTRAPCHTPVAMERRERVPGFEVGTRASGGLKGGSLQRGIISIGEVLV